MVLAAEGVTDEGSGEAILKENEPDMAPDGGIPLDDFWSRLDPLDV